MKIVVFTADVGKGAMHQLSLTLAESCKKLKYEVELFLPDTVRILGTNPVLSNIVKYKKIKNLYPYNKGARKVVKRICAFNPNLVILVEDSIFSMQVLMNLPRCINKTFMIHDVIMHPSNASFSKRLNLWISKNIFREIGLKKANFITLLSLNSINKFTKVYRKGQYKIHLFPLCAHVPFCNRAIPPKELIDNMKFILFFGRIDRYKGVSKLVEAFNNLKNDNLNLIIAGSGNLDDVSKTTIFNNDRIIFLNRFILDEEMVWLFKKSIAVVLPYEEASQSGVLPIAYYFGKPVVASDISGLKEMVEEGKTGFLFASSEELTQILSGIMDWNFDEFKTNCLEFSKKHLDWGNNIEKLIQE